MSFASITYLFFLPIVFLLYWFVFDYLIRKSSNQVSWQNAFVVVASYVFYGWWNWRFLFLIIFTSLTTYISGLLIEQSREKNLVNPAKTARINRKKDIAKLWMWLNVLINIGVLCAFKYYNFFVQSFADLFGLQSDKLLINVILPIGISFYTFQALSYSIDVYRKTIPATHDIVAFFAYIAFFPQLVAGPIERASHLLPQFLKKRKFDYQQGVDGLRQMLWGFFKKIVIADNCARYIENVLNDYQNQSGLSLLLFIFVGFFHIYCDFSGYSDIAIGTARLFGIYLKENFRTPQFSRDVSEWCRRWHISLNSWLNDYLFVPLYFKHNNVIWGMFSALITFLVCGLWHGASWNFIVLWLYCFILFLPSVFFGKLRARGEISKDRWLPSLKDFGRMFITFCLISVGSILFYTKNLSQAKDIIYCGLTNSFCGEVSEICYKLIFPVVLLLVVEWINRNKRYSFDLLGKPCVVRYLCYFVVLLSIFIFGGETETFVYFQF